jgi:hypothetical protein
MSRLTCAAFAAVVGAALVVAPLRAADPTLAATWRADDVAVDGSVDDWPSLTRIGEGPAVALRNDGSALYLAVASNDPVVRQQLATGLVVWLDGQAHKAQTFGIRLPGLVRRPLRGANPGASADDVLGQAVVRNVLQEFDRLGPGRGQRRLVENPAAIGLALASGVEDGTIVYELKLPLDATDATPQAVGVRPGATIALGLETPADPKPPRERNRLDDPMNTNIWVSNPYGGYFDPPPPPGGYPRPEKPVVIKPMKLIWVIAHLAPAP